MKRITFVFYIAVLISIFGISCVKDRNTGPDFSSTQPVLELRTPISNMAGLTNFSRAVIGNLPSDTTQFYINLASNNTLSTNLNVTIGVDQTRLDAYNADDANAVKYELLPDSDYTILKTAGTIVAGQRIDSFQVVFFRDKIDPVSNYMLPLAITDGNNILISQNQGIIWFHSIGNPLAGTYLQDFYRWNDAPDTTGPPNSTVFEGEPVAIPPINPTTIFFPEGYLDANGLGGVSLSFTNTNGVITNPSLFIDDATQSNIDAVGFKVLTAPTLVSYEIVGDASTKYAGTYFRFYFEILNNANGNRKTINQFTKQ